MEVDIKGAAAVAETAIERFAKIEPTIATAASMFVPGAAPVVAMVQPEILIAIPFVELALRKIAAGQNMDGASAIFELIKHLMPGQANSPILADVVAASTAQQQDGLDPSKIPVG
jgi:hypothetical protein